MRLFYLLTPQTAAQLQLVIGNNQAKINPSYNIEKADKEYNSRQTFYNPHYTVRIMPDLPFILGVNHTTEFEFLEKLEETIYAPSIFNRTLLVDISLPVNANTCITHGVNLENTLAMNSQLTISRRGGVNSGTYSIGSWSEPAEVGAGLTMWVRCLGSINTLSSGSYRIIAIYDKVSNGFEVGKNRAMGTWLAYIIPSYTTKLPWIGTVPLNDVIEIGTIVVKNSYFESKFDILFIPGLSFNTLTDKQSEFLFYVPGIKGTTSATGLINWLDTETESDLSLYASDASNSTKWLDAYTHGLHTFFNFKAVKFEGKESNILNIEFNLSINDNTTKIYTGTIPDNTKMSVAAIEGGTIWCVSPLIPQSFTAKNIIRSSHAIRIYGHRSGFLYSTKDTWQIMATPYDLSMDDPSPYRYAMAYERIGHNDVITSQLFNNVWITEMENGLCEVLVETSRYGAVYATPARSLDRNALKTFFKNRTRFGISKIYGYLWEQTGGDWTFIVTNSYTQNVRNVYEDKADWFVIYAQSAQCWVRSGAIELMDEDELEDVVEKVDDLEQAISAMANIITEIEYCEPLVLTNVINDNPDFSDNLSTLLHLAGISCEDFDLSAHSGMAYGLVGEKWGMYNPLASIQWAPGDISSEVDGLISVDQVIAFDNDNGNKKYYIYPPAMTVNTNKNLDLTLTPADSDTGTSKKPIWSSDNNKWSWKTDSEDWNSITLKVITDVWFDVSAMLLMKSYRTIRIPMLFVDNVTKQSKKYILKGFDC